MNSVLDHVYAYGDKGHAEPMSFERCVEATAEELLDRAVMLTGKADGNTIWDEDIRSLEADGKPDKEAVNLFVSLREAYEPMIERRALLSKTAIVSNGELPHALKRKMVL